MKQNPHTANAFLLFVKPSPSEAVEFYANVLAQRIIEELKEGASLDGLGEELLDKLFELRILALKHALTIQDIEELKEVSMVTVANPPLNILLEETWGYYQKIVQSCLKEAKQDSFEANLKTNLDNHTYTFQTLSLTAQLFPSFQKSFQWIKASLLYELGLIVVLLMHENKLKMDVLSVDSLRRFIRVEFEKFAAYTMLLGLWEPDEEDESQLIRNIEIVLSKLEVEYGYYQEMPIGDFLAIL